ncbi:MAG: hypothetical protein OEN56_15390 [Gemmatimonadota bacterium]|nr:hypothetical protein [Gemmatimonadota bacterium]
MRSHKPLFGIVLALTALTLGQAVLPSSAMAQSSSAAPLTRAQLDEFRATLQQHMDREGGRLSALQRQVDVAMLFYRLRDVANVDEVRFFGPPSEEGEEPRAITALVFVPKRTDGAERGSLLIWQRGADALEIESWSDVPELQELAMRGVTVIAPTYRGAPEERLDAVPEYALQRYPFLDRGRVTWREPS